MLFSVETKVRGRFSEKRCGPSRRCARNASAALENFVCCPEKTFSTASTQRRSGGLLDDFIRECEHRGRDVEAKPWQSHLGNSSSKCDHPNLVRRLAWDISP